MTTLVTALLVSHDGARWLPAVLDGLAAQTRPVDRVVAVDTGSDDVGPGLLRDRLVGHVVLDRPATCSYVEAVGTALAQLPPGTDDEWVWLLHDDSAPAPDALERLLDFAASDPSAAVLGPKLREWPSLRRLLEVGVTIGGTGRRETGLEPGEYDQGQHDRARDVLAVHTAGMLVRRSLLELQGLDPELPVFGNDLDFGWRASAAGHRVVVVPDAVVFHAEAAHRGVRRTTDAGGARRGERAAALYVLLVNASAAVLPFQAVRLLLGSLLRAAGLLLVRAPREALDELAAVGSTYLHPGRLLAGRRARRGGGGTSVRHLLAPAWLPYRHGLDAVGDLAGAVVDRAGEVSARRRVPSLPVAAVFAVLVVGALVAARGLVGSGMLAGGALLPAPDGATHWWHTYLSSRHDVGTGSSAPAAPYLLPLAVLGSLLLGKAWLLVDVLFLLAVPLAAWGGYRFLLRVTGSRVASLWGAAAYGVLPVVTGAVQQGRLGTVAGALVLPWLAHSAVFLGGGSSPDRRSRAAWRTALWLAVLTAFVPAAWALAAALGLVAVAAARSGRRAVVRSVAVPLLASLVLLLPWTVATWSHQGAASWLFEAGLPAPDLTGPLTRWDALTGRPGAGAPGWLSLGVLAAAVLALVRPDTRRGVLRAWAVLVVSLFAVTVLGSRTWSPAAGGTDQPLWLGFPLVLAQAAAITAAALAGAGVRERLTGASFGWRQPVGVAVVLLAVAAPVAGAAWWVATGSGGPLDRGPASTVPTYMADAAAADPAHGVLVVRGSRTAGFTYGLLRSAGPRLGDDSVQPGDREQAGLTRTVTDLATAPDPDDVAGLAARGVAFVYAAAPADPSLVGNLDSVSGLTPGSAGRGARAWQVETQPDQPALTGPGDPLRPWLLILQGAALVAAVVLAVPSRKVRR